MKIRQFKELVRALPYKNQSFDIKKENWKCSDQVELIERIFDGRDKVTLNRYDVINSWWNMEEFVLKTLMWGYPIKGRGNNINNLLKEENFKDLVSTLHDYLEKEISLERFIADTKRIQGLGLSTMSKFAYFLRTRINGKTALILDLQIIESINDLRFEELNSLQGLNYTNSLKKYADYLEVMHKIAEEIKVEPDQVEFFVFNFGRGLSEMKGEECYDYD